MLWLLNWGSYVDRQIAIWGDYEREQAAFLLVRMAEQGCDAFLDVGANFGFYALRVARRGLAREVHAFEPDPRSRAQFSANLYLNRLTGGITLHACAASETGGELDFELYPEKSIGMTRVASAGAVKVAQAGTALPIGRYPSVALDDAMNFMGRKLFFKIDVEGHEMSVLRGARRLLADNDCFLQVEAWPENASALESLMAGLGYRLLHRIDNDRYFARA